MKNIYTFSIIACLLLVNMLFTNRLQAQTVWHEHSSTQQYKIEYSDVVVCTNSQADIQSEYVFLKISNLTSSTLTLSFRTDLFYVGSGCVTCDNPEYIQRITIPANSSLSADCDFLTTGNRELLIFKKFINRANQRDFEKFEITQVQVN